MEFFQWYPTDLRQGAPCLPDCLHIGTRSDQDHLGKEGKREYEKQFLPNVKIKGRYNKVLGKVGSLSRRSNKRNGHQVWRKTGIYLTREEEKN